MRFFSRLFVFTIAISLPALALSAPPALEKIARKERHAPHFTLAQVTIETNIQGGNARRDQRFERRDERQDRRFDRRDERQDRRVERRDERQDRRFDRRDERQDRRFEQQNNQGFVTQPVQQFQNRDSRRLEFERREAARRAYERQRAFEAGRRAETRSYRGYQGYRDPRHGYRRHTDGFWYPPAAFIIGGGIGSIIIETNRSQNVNTERHHDWCEDHYHSYRRYDGTFQPNHGPRRRCDSPFDGL